MFNKKYFLYIILLLSILYWFFLLKAPAKTISVACQKMQQNDAEMQHLSHSIDSVWAATHATIEQSLPTNIDTLLKIRLTTLKQVKYITSYKYFKEMSPELQQLILKTGVEDSLSAMKMRNIMAEQVDLQNDIFQSRNALKSRPLGGFFMENVDCK